MSDRTTRTVKQIAESDKFDIIFREVAWGSHRIDITDKVIKAIDESRHGAPWCLLPWTRCLFRS